MQRSSEKLDRATAPRARNEVEAGSAVPGFVRSRDEGKKIGHPPVTLIRRDLAETIMVKPVTKLAPWRSAGRVTRGRAAAPPCGAGRIPPAARDKYPLTTPPVIGAATNSSMDDAATAAPPGQRGGRQGRRP